MCQCLQEPLCVCVIDCCILGQLKGFVYICYVLINPYNICAFLLCQIMVDIFPVFLTGDKVSKEASSKLRLLPARLRQHRSYANCESFGHISN